MASTTTAKSKNNGAVIGFEAKLWLAADKLRNNMDAAEYKHVVLGLIFFKYISDAFEEMRAKLLAGKGDYEGSDPEDADEYRAENVFWVPKEARWHHLQASAKQAGIGKVVDDAMVAIERDNPRLKGVLPKDYARPGLDKHRLGELIDLIGTIGLGDAAGKSKDVLGRVYEYFLTQFASAEGKNGGQFYTPNCIVRLIVGMLSPYKGERGQGNGRGPGGNDQYMAGATRDHERIGVRGQTHGTQRTQGSVIANPPFNDSDCHRADDDVLLAVRSSAQGQRQLRLGAALHPPPRAGWLRGIRAGQRQYVVEPIRRRRDPAENRRGRSGGLHGRVTRPALLFDADPGLPLVYCEE